MVGPEDYHSKWSKPEKDKYHMIPLIFRISNKWTNELIYKTETVTDLENKLWLSGGKGRLEEI